MELMDDIEVTEFSLNGVPLGKLPCEIPVDKLRRLLPKFIDAVRGQQAFENIYHLIQQFSMTKSSLPLIRLG